MRNMLSRNVFLLLSWQNRRAAFFLTKTEERASIPREPTMQTERLSQHPPQEIQVTHLVPEQALPAMQQAIMNMLETLPTPITVIEHQDTQQKTYYTYQVGEQTEAHPFGIAMGATPDFLDAMRFSLEAAMQHRTDAQEGEVDM